MAASTTEFAIGVEHHRNTATASKRDLILAGFGATGGISGDSGGLNYRATLKYKDDRKEKAHGLVASVDLFPYIPTRLNATMKLSPDIYVTPTTSLGLQYERETLTQDIASSPANIVKGSVMRGTAAVGFAFDFGKRWTTSFDVGYWRDFRQTGSFEGDEKSKVMRRATIAYKLDDSGNALIALSRTHGSDPIEGIVREKYTQLVLQLNQKFFTLQK